MFDIGMPEFAVIAIVALMVIGPERLPEVMSKLGRWYGQARRMSDDLLGEARRQWQEGMREVEDVTSTVASAWQEATAADQQSRTGPPPRLLHLAAPLLPPETVAGAGPWVLPAWHRESKPDLEPQPAEPPAGPGILPRRVTLANEPGVDDLGGIGGPSLMGAAFYSEDLPYPEPEVEAPLPPIPPLPAHLSAGPPEPAALPGEARPAPRGRANGASTASSTRSATGVTGQPSNGQDDRGRARTAVGANGAGGEGKVEPVDARPVEREGIESPAAALSERERTVIDLYRSGGITVETAAGFLQLTPAEFRQRLEGFSLGATPLDPRSEAYSP